jgi:hypothetical protein
MENLNLYESKYKYLIRQINEVVMEVLKSRYKIRKLIKYKRKKLKMIKKLKEKK